MPSTFFGLNIAYSGLTAANVGLNTTGNNIANAETDGYSRQQVVQQAYEALRTFTTYGSAGAGVDTIAIERMRDDFYDVKYWNSSTNTGEYTEKVSYMKQLENYFNDNGKTSKGFNTIFNAMYDALATLKNSSGDTTKKTAFIGSAKSLTDYFNNLSGNLKKVQQDANEEIKLKTNQINTIAQQIASLNKQINAIELSGITANELRDKRTVLVDELSAIVDVEVKETPVRDSSNPDRLTGANNYVVTIAGGQGLVDGDEYNKLKCVPRSQFEKINQSDIDGLYDIKWEDGSNFAMHQPGLGGELRGLIDMRDGNNGANFNGAIKAADYDTQKVTIEATAEYLKNLNACTLPEGGGVITLGNQVFRYDSWSYTADTTTNPATYSYTFQLSSTNTEKITSNAVGKQASVGESIEYQGIPYYMEQMNEFVRGFAAAFNKILTQPGSMTSESVERSGSNLFTGNWKGGNKQYEFPDDPDNTVNSTDDCYYRLTAENFSIVTAYFTDPDKLATHTVANGGIEKNDILEDLIDLKTDKNAMNFRGGSASTFLQTVYADIIVNTENADTFYANYNSMTKSVDNQRISVSGVDKDEEAVNLVKYQNSFTLASKMIQTLTEIYDRLILQTGV